MEYSHVAELVFTNVSRKVVLLWFLVKKLSPFFDLASELTAHYRQNL